MVLAAQFVYGLHQDCGVFGVHVRRDPVSQVENVAVAPTECRQDFGDLVANDLGRCIQHGRVQVALQGNPVTDTAARGGQVC